MRTALEKLGYDGVYHMNSVMQNPPDSHMWIDFFKWKYFGQGKPFTRKDWDQLLGDTQVNSSPRSCYAQTKQQRPVAMRLLHVLCPS
jgi:hypothetical protein